MKKDLSTFEPKEIHEELLDNIPCGVGVFTYENGVLSIIYVNKRYWELVNKDPLDNSLITIKNVVYEDDVTIACQEIESAILQNREGDCYARVRCGDKGYRPFHVQGKINKVAENSYIIYASFTLVDDEVMSYQKMLPVAMSTLMSTSGDIMFIKDKSLRYVCCSPSAALSLGVKNPNDIIGKSDADLFDESIAKRFHDLDYEILNQGKSIVDRIIKLPPISKIEDADNSVHIVKASKYPLRDSHGNIIGLYGYGQDITDQQQKEFRLELLTKSIPGGLASFIVDAGKLRRLYYNDGFSYSSGYSKEEYADLTKDDLFALIIPEDRGILQDVIEKACTATEGGLNGECEYRCTSKSGKIQWMNMRYQLAQIYLDQFILNIVQIDVTEQKAREENLRILEEEYRLAAQQTGRTICRYNIKEKALVIITDNYNHREVHDVRGNFPQCLIDEGKISEDTKEACLSFFHNIDMGIAENQVMYQELFEEGWRWLEAHATTLFSKEGEPLSALITYEDITEQYEKDTIFRRWKQSLNDRCDSSYSLIRCNMQPKSYIDTVEGSLLSMIMEQHKREPFDVCMTLYAEKQVLHTDRSSFASLLKMQKLLEQYNQGIRKAALEYREVIAKDVYRWIRCSIDLIERPDSDGVMAYLMFEDIDESKRAELMTQTLAETDVLTGLLNRKAFADRLNARLAQRSEKSLYAFLIMDLDRFKQVNDTLGHAAGDRVLIETGNIIKSALLDGDLVGRLGGDEFMICLCNVPDRAVIRKKARRIWKLVHRTIDNQVELSASIGITICPEDGNDFATLYQKADITLYQIKKSGKDNYGFYCRN